ncbi:hypothetical protein EVAR_22088_1 [Eumeta japonica]|uniref:Uncharacterized protein n=1 Tax=Eumeta variegata TaxID=151549 RepID=A0A4C1UU14_EUMVA|nr:hypothetical protein EVAR_22088_1 [Eumeta japonica]
MSDRERMSHQNSLTLEETKEYKLLVHVYFVHSVHLAGASRALSGGRTSAPTSRNLQRSSPERRERNGKSSLIIMELERAPRFLGTFRKRTFVKFTLIIRDPQPEPGRAANATNKGFAIPLWGFAEKRIGRDAICFSVSTHACSKSIQEDYEKRADVRRAILKGIDLLLTFGGLPKGGFRRLLQWLTSRRARDPAACAIINCHELQAAGAWLHGGSAGRPTDVSVPFVFQYTITLERPLQLILWRDDETLALTTLQLNTLTYGTASAPFLNIRCLLQLSKECSDQKIASIIEHDFNVDDLNTN